MFDDEQLLKSLRGCVKKKSYNELINKNDLSDNEMDDLFLDY